MPHPFQHARPGQSFFPVSPTAWNAMLDSARAFRGDQFTGDPKANPFPTTRSSTLVKVYNNTGAALDRNDVVGLSGPYWDPLAQLDAFRREVVLVGDVPSAATHTGRFGVLLEPVLSGYVGRAWVSGVCPVKLDLIAVEDQYADVLDGDVTQLVSGGSGSAQILWTEADSGTYGYGYSSGTQWAVVRIGQAPPSLQLAKVTSAGGLTAATTSTAFGSGTIQRYTTFNSGTGVPGGLTGVNETCWNYHDKKFNQNATVLIGKILGVLYALDVWSCTGLT